MGSRWTYALGAAAAFGVLATAAAVGCSSFGANDSSSTGPDGAADGSTTNGAVGDAGDAGSGDAGAGANDGASACNEFPFTEGFEGPDWTTSWGTADQGDIAVVADGGATGSHALAVVLPGSGAARWIAHDFGGPCDAGVVSVSAKLRFETFGNGEVDFFQVTDPQDAVALVHQGNGGSFAFEFPTGNGGGTQKVIATPGTDWVTVRVDLDFGARVFTASLVAAGATSTQTGVFPVGWPVGTVSLYLGVPYASNNTIPWTVHFDDVVIQVR